MSTVNRQSGGDLRRRGVNLVNVHCEASKWWEFTKCPLCSVDLNGGDLLNVHRELSKWLGFTSKRWGFTKCPP